MASYDSMYEMIEEVAKLRQTTIVGDDGYIRSFCKEIQESQRAQRHEVNVREIVNAYVNEQKTRPTNPAWDKFWES